MPRCLLVVTLVTGLVGGTVVGRTALARPEPPADDRPLKLPAGWKAEDPVPLVKSNCMRCHLTAGRELTTPVRDFARSVHDRARLSCNDCHGGDTEHDSTAHEPEHGFIGTKLSAHMAACADCHPRETITFRKSKHYWDLSRRINRDYPVCVDCHGNHDVGRPPAEFTLTNVCTDCHKQFARDLGPTADVVAENDRLWRVLRKVHAKNVRETDPTPPAFREEVDGVRTATARLLHRGRPVTAAEAGALNERVGSSAPGWRRGSGRIRRAEEESPAGREARPLWRDEACIPRRVAAAGANS